MDKWICIKNVSFAGEIAKIADLSFVLSVKVDDNQEDKDSKKHSISNIAQTNFYTSIQSKRSKILNKVVISIEISNNIKYMTDLELYHDNLIFYTALQNENEPNITVNALIFYHAGREILFPNIKHFNHLPIISQCRAINYGSYGHVYVFKDDNDEEYAYKSFDKSHLSIDYDNSSEIREMLTLMSISKHPCIVELKGYTLDEINFYFGIVLEFASKGSLQQNMENLTITEKSKVVFGMLSSLSYLNSIGIVYRDLAPKNILIKENNEMLLCDFGTSRFMTSITDSYTINVGTYKYLSPEMENNRPYDFTTDVYSFGLVVKNLIDEDSIFIDACLNKSPIERPTFEELIYLMKLNRLNFVNSDFKKLEEYMNNSYISSPTRTRNDYQFYYSQMLSNRDIRGINRCGFLLYIGDDIAKASEIFHVGRDLKDKFSSFMFEYILEKCKVVACERRYSLLDNLFDLLPEDDYRTYLIPNLEDYLISEEVFKKEDVFTSKFIEYGYFEMLRQITLFSTIDKTKLHYKAILKDIVGDVPSNIIQLYINSAKTAPIAYLYLGIHYILGIIVKEDLNKAFEYMQIGHEKGSKVCSAHAGIMLCLGKGTKKDFERGKSQFIDSIAYASGGYYSSLNSDYFEKFYNSIKLPLSGVFTNMGLFYKKNEEFSVAKLLLLRGSACRDDNCNFYLGKLYFKKHLKEKNYYQIGVRYLLLAQSQGNIAATKYLVANKIITSGNTQEEQLKLYLSKGDYNSAFALGQKYINEGKYEEAKMILKEAVDNGDVNCVCVRGLLYLLENDGVKAKELLVYSAERGYAPAQAQLGWYYFEGKYCEQDLKIAQYYAQLAANQGDDDGLALVGEIRMTMKIFDATTFYYLEMAAGKGNQHATRYLAEYYLKIKDAKKALIYIKYLLQEKHPDGYFLIACMFLSGNGVIKNMMLARCYFEQAKQAKSELYFKLLNEIKDVSHNDNEMTNNYSDIFEQFNAK